ncbi:HAD superfamily isoform 1 [Hibiscus syriacus]|uniref:HAD superfamily isoform 1 n=1 Tax=Hibiscus syriacus TaxID=106335 RepID=A0A6A2YGB3_HIBSY|nr:HAD superfamily isoform 1 [Hibiscus syriacus]
MTTSSESAAIAVGGGVGINIGGGGGGVWVGVGINNKDPTPSGPSASKLNSAYTALQAWKSAITDDPLGVLKTWEGLDVCSYKGVFCSYQQGGMDSSNACGSHRSESCKSSRFNTFSGSIPDGLFNKGLDAIFLDNNRFEGELPSNLGNSPASVINLANNKFNANIPSSFGFMSSKLKELLLLKNQLTGCIPHGVGMFSEMQVFDVTLNSLLGHLPDSICGVFTTNTV